VESPLSYPITVTGSNPYGDMYAIAYFDWNQDGIFEDAQQIGGNVTANPAVFTGTINISAAALAGNARMRVVTSYSELPASACSGPTYGGQTEDYLLNVTPATCIPPSATTFAITNIGAHSANLAWGASTGGNIVGYAWEVRSSGTPGTPGAAANGTTAPGTTTATATGLTANTTYTLYVRSDCGAVDGQSVWMSKAFTTELGCGSTWVSPGGAANLSDVQFTQTHTVCPDNAGDKVTVNFTTWNGLRWNAPNASRMYIFDGNSTAAPMVAGGNGPAYSGSEWTIPAGGWTSTNTANKPPMYTSTAANGCLTLQVYSAGVWTGGMGWSADLTCAPPPTCFAPTNLTVTSTTVHGASFSWNAGASPNVEYKVVAGGSPASAAAITSGTSATGSATTAAVLTANTLYTAYFRGNCGGGDLSAWSTAGLNFTTKVGCGGPYNIFYRPSGNVAPFDSVMTICPDNAGDVVTYTVGTPFSLGTVYQGTAFYVYNGPNTSAELFNSGAAGFTVGANSIPAGGFYGSTAPGPFTSSHASGCLTLRFRSVSIDTYYNKPVKGTVSCAAAPACSTPNAVTFSAIGGTSATVSWGNTTQPCIIEYGPANLTPGTGATAGTGGTIASSNATSPFVISGLSPTTTYSVFVRQICSGPSYSANSFRASFTTSMDCSTAQLISCGVLNADDNAPPAYDNGNAAYNGDKYTGAASCFSGGASDGNGPERLYRFTATQAGTYGVIAGISDIGGTTKVSYVMTSVANGCAASAFTCVGSVPSNAGGILSFNVPAAGDYYLMSDANYAVHKRPFTLGCPGIPSCVANPTNPANGTTMAVNTNNIAFTWPAVFGATGYDIYWNGSATPLTTVPTNSITPNGYTTAAVKALVGLGNPVSWRAVPKNSFGTATCPTNWNFRVGGNGAANAIPLTNGVANSGTRRTANGYTNLFSSTVNYYNYYGNPTTGNFTGNDSWYKFTASTCATSVNLNLCSTGSLAGNGDNIAMILVRASDMTQVGVAEYADNLIAPACLQHKTYNPVTDDFDYSVPNYTVTAGETYYVIMDGYASQNDFTITYTEVLDPTDSDGDGIPDCADSCPFLPGQEGDPCTPSSGFAVGQIINCECVDGNMAVVKITTDANPAQISWEVTDPSGATVLAQGTPSAANTTVSSTVFLAGSCYGFKLMDSFGDGIANGGWELRTTTGGLILKDSFSNGSVS
ncbi:MAG: fibronectin type III domain-containing protein, partial [Proteobacteria bacterium]|nr:fibronectin type III domain-containing protein [Pseudomonadota bacterium]